MSYAALYRKFRPQTFSEVKGQDHIVRTLKNQIKNNKTGHAYLFTGTRGTGKTSVAKIMAKALNCLDPKDGQPCCECENCLAITAGSFIDVIEMDAASNNGVDDIRNLIEETRYTPAKGKYKVFIIDEAHMITKAAFNAFLKTLEEPPSYAVFILATTEPHKLPQTILSRVQRYDFRRIEMDVIKENLKEIVIKEGQSAQEKALEYIARSGDGSMRDAVSLLDKCLAYSLGKELTYDLALEALGALDTGEFSALLRTVYKGDSAGALLSIDRAVSAGKDLSQYTADFCGYLRNVLLAGINPQAAEKITGMSSENMELLKEDAALADPEILIRYIRILSELINKMRFSAQKQLLCEIEFIKLTRPQMETDYSSLLDRIRQLEARPGAFAGPERAPEAGNGKEAQSEHESSVYPDEETYYEQGFMPQEIYPGEPAPEDENERIDLVRIAGSVSSKIVSLKLKKAQAQKEEGIIAVYVSGAVAKGTLEGAIDEIKAAFAANGYDEEIVIREGSPSEEALPGISEAELFKNINFEITQEEF